MRPRPVKAALGQVCLPKPLSSIHRHWQKPRNSKAMHDRAWFALSVLSQTRVVVAVGRL
jgi:hypothetical protein